MNSSSYQGEVVLADNGEIHNPFHVDIASAIIKSLCCSIGIPLNLFVAFTICHQIHRRRLQRKARNYFLLVIILSQLSFFMPPAIELIYWALYPVESLCHAYVAVVIVPQGLLLTNMLLALTDRYLAINHPLLHRRKMTNRLAAFLMITCSTFTVFLIKIVYMVQLGTVRCEVWLVDIKEHAIILIVLFASCIVLNITIYRQTKTLLRESRTPQVKQDERDPSNRSTNVHNDATAANPVCIHTEREELGAKTEMEATRALVIGVASLCLMSCLTLIFNASYFACRLIFGQSSCGNFLRIVPLVKELSLTPAIYSPITFLKRKKERVECACKIV